MRYTSPPDEELIHEEERDGFTVRFYASPEDTDPHDSFDPAIEEEFDTFGKIERGELAWFRAHVVASKAGVDLGHDWLGACCYESAQAFVTPGDGYWEDMVREAIAEAKQVTARLTKV